MVGGLALAAIAPLCVGGALVGGATRVDARCLSAFGSLNGGMCLDQPSGGSVPGAGAPPGAGVPPGPGVPGSGVPSVGVPSVAIGPTDNGGPGISTSPLFPGQTFNIPLAP